MQEGSRKQPLQCRPLQLRIALQVVAMLQRLLRIPARQHSRTIARPLLNPARRLVRTHIWRPVQPKLASCTKALHPGRTPLQGGASTQPLSDPARSHARHETQVEASV